MNLYTITLGATLGLGCGEYIEEKTGIEEVENPYPSECDVLVGDLAMTNSGRINYFAPENTAPLDATATLKALGLTSNLLEEIVDKGITEARLYGLWEERDEYITYNEQNPWLKFTCTYLDDFARGIQLHNELQNDNEYAIGYVSCLQAQTNWQCDYTNLSPEYWCSDLVRPPELQSCPSNEEDEE